MTTRQTYTLLIYRTAPGEPDVESSELALEGHRRLQAETKARGELLAVARLDAAPRAKTVRGQRGAHEVTDGPYVDTKEWLVGFYLLECSSEEEALERARTICPVADHAIEVRPVTWHATP